MPKGASPAPRKLPRSFYDRPAIELAPQLLGTILVRQVDGTPRRARLAEVEAYIGPHDLACHASKGRTPRTDVMFGPPGHAYVYFIYGMYDMFNIVAAGEGDPQAVLVRAAEPLDGWDVDLTGPGKLARAFQITGADNRRDLTGDGLYLARDDAYQSKIARSKRIGVDYAGRWKDRLLRFVDRSNPISQKLRK